MQSTAVFNFQKWVEKARILWVDDNTFAAGMYVQLLVSLGCRNVMVLAGKDASTRAIELMRSENFDIVFTDRKMPKYDGFDVAAAVSSLLTVLHFLLSYIFRSVAQIARLDAAGQPQYLWSRLKILWLGLREENFAKAPAPKPASFPCPCSRNP